MPSSMRDPEDEALYCEVGQSCTIVCSNASSFRPAPTMKVRKTPIGKAVWAQLFHQADSAGPCP